MQRFHDAPQAAAQMRVLQHSKLFGTQTVATPPSTVWSHLFGVAPEQVTARAGVAPRRHPAIAAISASTTRGRACWGPQSAERALLACSLTLSEPATKNGRSLSTPPRKTRPAAMPGPRGPSPSTHPPAERQRRGAHGRHDEEPVCAEAAVQRAG
jgi:hypothetical protein